MNTSTSKVFLITGVNSGFGLAFSKAALSAGHTVIGTARTEAAKTAFEELNAERAHGVVLDVTNFAAVEPAIKRVTERAGQVDVLINNAGYGHEGPMEESPLDEIIAQFNANVFGAVAMMKAVLPSMRERRTGHIINITSMGGLMGLPGVSYYCGSKFALDGISESLEKEVRGFGIKVTSVAPGSFRTDWAGRSLVRTERSIEDYDKVFDPIRRARATTSLRRFCSISSRTRTRPCICWSETTRSRSCAKSSRR